MSTSTSRVRPRSNSADVDQGPPLQRPKLDGGSDAQRQASNGATRDEKYYRSDGDCIIRVENILFKIHRYLLLADSNSSVFHNMFSLPSGTLPSEGQHDDDPIVLSGDTVAQFRDFMAFSYAHPSQLQISRMSVEDLKRLVNLIQFAHKYLLQHSLLWALESMEHVLEHSAAAIPENEYPLILHATTLCAPLHARICDHICESLKGQWIIHIKANVFPIAPALDVAETFHLRPFLTALYVIVLDRLATCSDPTRVSVDGPLSVPASSPNIESRMESVKAAELTPRSHMAVLDREELSGDHGVAPGQRIRTPVVKDEQYYRSDGDCIIQVENVLFKIHRYHLSGDSPILENMFSLPSGNLPSEGQDDDNPIVLSGDTLAQFRAFLYFSYSVFGKEQVPHMSFNDLERLVDVIQFAHKYLMEHSLLFALESMEHILVHSNWVTVLESQYVMVLEATALCSPLHAALCERIRDQLRRGWIEQIKADTRFLRLTPALEIAETFGFKPLLAEIYWMVLRRLSGTEEQAVKEWLSTIDPIHRLRIFSGHWFLLRSLTKFINDPPTSGHYATCLADYWCRQHFAIVWRSQGEKHVLAPGNPKDVFQRLDAFKEAVIRGLEWNTARCPAEARIDAAIAALQNSHCFFAIPEDDPIVPKSPTLRALRISESSSRPGRKSAREPQSSKGSFRWAFLLVLLLAFSLRFWIFKDATQWLST
ncbi:BTB domain-containing protein [Mycena venus]|uniref:BTB domain-containing protein n=1 Tax=Mycena venus TaxID=2733690 RepID=A0A8H6YXC6_9AGAR|nr:BTB domain-containing protein [Mycena venus]